MNKKKELKYLDKLFKKMKQQFKSFVHTQSPEALHGFRVQVKKARSFLTLLEAGKTNNKLLKTFKPVKKIFKQTGIIRDAYIHQKQADENHINRPELTKTQYTLQVQETAKVILQQDKMMHKIKNVKEQLQHHIHSLSKIEIEHFFTVQIRQTQKLLCSHNFSEQLHNGRKMLKHLLYNKNIIPGAVAKEMHINFKEIDTMQQALGEWHDNKLALEFFHNKVPGNELIPMQQKQEDLKKNITTKAADFTKISI